MFRIPSGAGGSEIKLTALCTSLLQETLFLSTKVEVFYLNQVKGYSKIVENNWMVKIYVDTYMGHFQTIDTNFLRFPSL